MYKSKDELLSKEDDNECIKDFIDDNLLDELYNNSNTYIVIRTHYKMSYII